MFFKKPIALVDICNTLADVNGELTKLLGENPDPESYFHQGVTKTTFIDNPQLFSEASVIKGAVEGVNELSNKYEVVYLTARPEWAREITEQWLKRNGFPEGKIIFSGDKASVAIELKASVAIDDAPFELNALSEVVPTVLIHKQSYNLNLCKIGRLFSWQEFGMIFV